MKIIIFLLSFVLTSALFSCKKVKTLPTNSNPTTQPNSVVCVDNPSINFITVGTPIGNFSDCIKDIDGNVYKTVTIGTQTWMAENLKTSKYNDGTTIPNITDNIQWVNLTTGAWSYYKNDAANNAKYGKLYNWYALSKSTNGNKNVCPTGWHVPTDAEWTILTGYLGGDSIAGGKMKEVGVTSWLSPNIDATNTSLFSALSGGYRYGWGSSIDYSSMGYYGYWWSSTELNTNNSWVISLGYNNSNAHSYGDYKNYGLSVRCLKE